MQFTMKQRGTNTTPPIVMKSSAPVDTPTVVRSIVEMLEDPSEHTYDKIKAPQPPPAYNQTILQGGGNGGGTVIINPSVEFVTTDSHQVNTDGNIPVVVREAIEASEALQNTIPVSVVQASSSRKRTMMTRSLSRQASQVEIKEEPEEDTSDEEYIPEPVAKKSRVVFGQSHSAVTQRVRNAPGRKAKARGDGLDHMEPDERERILQRRRKNKEAAARCRQKRVDLTNTLAGQVEQEQQAKRKLEAEVQKLRLEAARLRRQLDAHRAAGCALEGTAGPAHAPASSTLSYQLPAGAVAIKSQAPPVIVQAAHGGHFVLSEGQQPQHIASSRPQRPQTLGLSQKQPMSKDKVQIRMEEIDSGYKVETPSRIIGGLAADLFTPTGLFGGLNTPCNETLTSLTAL